MILGNRKKKKLLALLLCAALTGTSFVIRSVSDSVSSGMTCSVSSGTICSVSDSVSSGTSFVTGCGNGKADENAAVSAEEKTAGDTQVKGEQPAAEQVVPEETENMFLQKKRKRISNRHTK